MEQLKNFFRFDGLIHWWFQNLNDNPRDKRLFWFRGSIGPNYRSNWLKYEIASGPALRLKYQHGEAGDDDCSSCISIGLGFVTAYLTFNLPSSWYFKRKSVATWDNNKEFYFIDGRDYGFYLFEWAFVWSLHAKINESSSSDPWWMRQYIRLDDLVLGRVEVLKDDLTSIDNIAFKIGNAEFLMNSIAWYRYRRFRRFIPYSLYHQSSISVDMKIDKPPMRRGKGENSWDCDDDGSFGLHTGWKFESPTWQNRDKCAELAVRYYVDSAKKEAKKYGSGSGPRGIKSDSEFTYIGRRQEHVVEVSELTDSALIAGEPNVTSH
jgi:hypothetical protein